MTPAESEAREGGEVRISLTLHAVPNTSNGLGFFNLDLVYDDTTLEAKAPEPNVQALNSTGRQFDCNDPGIPSPAGDIDEAQGPDHGRARLSCISLSSKGADGPVGDIEIASITFKALKPGETTLRLVDVAAGDPSGFTGYDPDGTATAHVTVK